jgi:serine/threonine protein kinase
MDDTEMKFTEEHLNSSKTLKVIQQGPIATTSLIETTYGKKFIIKKYDADNVAEARTEYLFLQTSHTDYAVKAIGYLAMDNPVIVLAYIEGKNLSNITFKEWKDYEICLTHLAQTVSIFHARGICLNDIKPDNLIINDGLAYITDLGMATVNLFYERHFRGTPAFAAPEKFTRFSNSFASDIFSLGMVLFFCKHGQTLLDLVGNEEYHKLITNEELWQKQLELLEDNEIILSMLNHNPSFRPRAIDIAIDLSKRHKIALDAIDITYIESYVFKSQHSAVEKLIKKKNLALDYSDEPQVIENMLSLWSESAGKKLIILDESLFVSQPDVFFKSFPFGYRDINSYQTNLIGWLLEQQISVLLRRNKQLNTTTFFEEIKIRTNAMQIWLGAESEVKSVTNVEINDLLSNLPAAHIDHCNLKKRLNQLKPFYVRILFMEMLNSKKHFLENNALTDYLDWIKISLPLVIVEKLWENWYLLVQDGLLSRKIIIENNIIWTDSRSSSPIKPDNALITKVIELSIKTGFNNIVGDIYNRLNEPVKAIEYWTRYVDDLIKNEYFISAYEFIRQLKKNIENIPFELQKKEAFLARMCGHFELSNSMYEQLISQSEGLTKAVLSVDQAIALQALKRFDEAIGLYQNAIDLFRLHKDLKSLFRAMNNLGVVYFGLQRYSEAEQLFYDVLNEAKEQNNVQFEAISYLNLSDIQLKRGEWKRVLYYTDKAIPMTLGKQKWNLYANGNVIRARALFALGETDDAIRILTELKDNIKIKENLLQYQEIIAWLMFFYNVCCRERAFELADNTGINEVSQHEILKRELFFTNLGRKKYLKAGSYLSETSETAIQRDFFDSDIDSIKEKLKDIRNQSEIDLYLYYLAQCILVIPAMAFTDLTEEILEAGNLYTYKPVEYLTDKLRLEVRPNLFWADQCLAICLRSVRCSIRHNGQEHPG